MIPTRSPKWISSENAETRSGDLERAHVEHDPCRVTAADAHGDGLVGDGRRRRTGGAEPVPARLHRVGALGPVRGVAGALLERLHEPEQPALLLVPALDRVAESPLTVLARLGVGGVGLAVHPGAVALEGHDRAEGGGQDGAVVGDHHDRLLGRADPLLELQLGRDVEEVVGLVEQQHVGVGGEQHVEDELLALAARQRAGGPLGDLVEGGAHDAPARRVPVALQLIAAERRPVRDRLTELDPRRRVAGRELGLERQHALARLADRERRQREQQLADGALVIAHADVLGHVADGPADRVLALVGRELAGQDLQQRALAHAVAADQARRAGRARPGRRRRRTAGLRPDVHKRAPTPPRAPRAYVGSSEGGELVRVAHDVERGDAPAVDGDGDHAGIAPDLQQQARRAVDGDDRAA